MQARELQNVAHLLAMKIGSGIAALPDSVPPKKEAGNRAVQRHVAVSLRMAVMAWETACERVRIARGKPLPGSLRPEAAKPKKTKAPAQSQWTETPEPGPAKTPAETPAPEKAD